MHLFLINDLNNYTNNTYQIIIKASDGRLHGNVFSGCHLCLNGFFLDAGEDLGQ